MSYIHLHNFIFNSNISFLYLLNIPITFKKMVSIALAYAKCLYKCHLDDRMFDIITYSTSNGQYKII